MIFSVQNFFVRACLIPELNYTNLVLIPKVHNPSKVGQF